MHSLIQHVTEDIQGSEYLRLLAILPVSRPATDREAHGFSPAGHTDGQGIAEVTYAYAYEPPIGKPRYFKGMARVHAAAGWPRQEFTTARQAIEACMYANGFGGKTPRGLAA